MNTNTNARALGQYFTTNSTLKEKVLEFILNEPSNILEPAIGRGDLVLFIAGKMPKTIFDMYEIDTDIELLDGVQKDKVVYGDFIAQNITKKYKTIIGNPPYVDRPKKVNLYIDFVEKCYNLLDDGGEMVFIVPSSFLKLTSASKLLNTMMNCGTFTHIFHPHDETMFENAAIDVIVFRYCKNGPSTSAAATTFYNEQLLYISNKNGLITFDAHAQIDNGIVTFQDYFDIYVGLVSGRESIYKNAEIGNIEVLTAENRMDKYVCVEKYPCGNKVIDDYLLEHKMALLERKIRKFNENNWYEWGALRNIKSIRQNWGKKCIYVHNLTRKSNVAFIDDVKYFGGGLIAMIPKKQCNLAKIMLYLNSAEFKENFTFAGRFKIGHRQLCNSRAPQEC